jgi:hypothetical protein
LATTSPQPIAQLRPDLPSDLSTMVESMLAKEPEQRPQSMQTVLDTLEFVHKHQRNVVDQVTLNPRPRTSGRFGGSFKQPKLVALGSMGFLLGLGLLGVIITIRYPDGREVKLETEGDVKVVASDEGDIEVSVSDSGTRKGSEIPDSADARRLADSSQPPPASSPLEGWSERTSFSKLLEIGARVKIRLPNGIEQDATRPEDFLGNSSIIHVYAERNPEFTDDFFEAYVVPLKQLQRLDIPRAPRLLDTERFYKGVGELKQLSQLLATLPLDDRGCQYLSQCEELAYLFWVAPTFSDVGAQELLKLKQLREFQFVDGDASDSSLATLLQLPNLDSFTVSGSKLSGDLLAGESPLSTLKGISLSFCRFTNDPLVYMERFPNLQVLQMQRFDDPGKGLHHLSGLRQLLDVNFQESSIRDLDGFRALAKAPRLQAVNFHACPNIGDEQIRAFVEGTPDNLKFLDISQTRVSDASIDLLITLPGLKDLVIWGVNVSDVGFSKLANSTTLTHLTIGSNQLTVDTVRALAAREMPWESIWIGEGQLGDDAIEELSNFKGLRSLRLSSNQISPQGMERLRKLLPNTQITQ